MYRIKFSPETEEHFHYLTSRQEKIVMDGIKKQLLHQPTLITKNRKPMRPNPLASWELRIRDLRVYYDVDDDKKIVYIIAVGLKKRNQVIIADKVINL